MAKYIVTYSSAASGYGWKKEYDRLDEFEDFINESRRDAMAYIKVYDTELNRFIFWKEYGFKPYIDMLADANRDMRTTTRKAKIAE